MPLEELNSAVTRLQAGHDISCRRLGPGDETVLESFLCRHSDSSMILRSNIRKAGLVDRGEPFQGTYVAAFRGSEIVGAAAHYWNDNLVLQTPAATSETARAAVAQSGRPVAGLLGPGAHVTAAREALGLAQVPARIADCDVLYRLELADLVVPSALAAGRVSCRRSEQSDLALLIDWRIAFIREAIAAPDTAETRDGARRQVELHHAERTLWLLLEDERPVAMTALNAGVPECVQVGGVWTPPEFRRRGYARCAVAASLLEVRAQRAVRAILFANDRWACRAYEALGFYAIGDYGLVLFDAPQRVPPEP